MGYIVYFLYIKLPIPAAPTPSNVSRTHRMLNARPSTLSVLDCLFTNRKFENMRIRAFSLSFSSFATTFPFSSFSSSVPPSPLSHFSLSSFILFSVKYQRTNRVEWETAAPSKRKLESFDSNSFENPAFGFEYSTLARTPLPRHQYCRILRICYFPRGTSSPLLHSPTSPLPLPRAYQIGTRLLISRW